MRSLEKVKAKAKVKVKQLLSMIPQLNIYIMPNHKASAALSSSSQPCLTKLYFETEMSDRQAQPELKPQPQPEPKSNRELHKRIYQE